jgi:flagellar basal body-associated protein FliL
MSPRASRMDEAEVRAARKRVAWLMLPVVVIALAVATVVFFVVWGFSHPGNLGP